MSAPDLGGAANNAATPLNDEGGGNAVFLDRHDVNCGSSGAISRLHLRRAPNGGRYQYEYACTPVPGLKNCVNKSTAANDDGRGNMIYLDRHDVSCDANQVLTRVHLTRPSENTCCSR